MPDWSLCMNGTCPFRKKCWRQTAKPSELKQSYTKFEPNWKEMEREGVALKDFAILNPGDYCDNFKAIPHAEN